MTDDEFRAKRAAYMREYRRKNAARINAQRRARRKASDGGELARERAWKAANPDKIREYKRRDREANPDTYRRARRAWEDRNKARVKARNRSDYEDNKEAIQRRIDKAKKANPERTRRNQNQNAMRRRVRLASVPSEKVSRDHIFERDRGICGICHRPVSRKSFSLDHIIPISVGGAHFASNIQLAHVVCNKRKGARVPNQLRIFLPAT